MGNILFFPEPFPSEDFRSIIYRYHIRSGNIEMQETKKELFDIASDRLGLFPRNLSNLINKLPEEYSEEFFLSHTWFPLFNPFLAKDRRSLVYRDILYGKDSINYVGKVVTQRNRPVLSKSIKYCPKCMTEDYENFGESYIHLEHQLDFLGFCPIHLVNLIEKCSVCKQPLSNIKKGVLTVKHCCNNTSYQQQKDREVINFKVNLLKELIFFKENASMIKPHILYMKIVGTIGKNGYIDNRGCFNKKGLLEDLTNKYQKECLDSINLDKDTFSRNSNLAYFLKQEDMSRFILVYILIIISLEGSVKSFLNNEEGYSIPIPFGNGPWSCENLICPSFQIRKSITHCKRTFYRGSCIGRFICTICGFEYTQKNSSVGIKSDNGFKVRKWGFLWKSKVEELYNCGYSVKEISKLTGSHINSIKHVMNNIKSMPVEQNNRSTSSLMPTIVDGDYLKGSKVVASLITDELKESHRNKIRNLKMSHENLTRTNLKIISSMEYKWIIKNDREWFNAILPPRKQSTINYAIIDDSLRVKVSKAAEIVLASNPTTRIKQYTILNKLNITDKNCILHQKEKLPKTVAELELHIESIEDYQVRHVPSIVSQLKAAGYVNVTLNSILAFRKSYRNCSEDTKNRIEEVLEKIQKGL